MLAVIWLIQRLVGERRLGRRARHGGGARGVAQLVAAPRECMMKAASIEFRNVSKLYGDVAAVRDISFASRAGTLVTLLGPSGCGKTTTLRMIAGLELPTAGTIAIGGNDVTRVPASERDVSMVFQSYALFPHMTVLENVGYGLTVARLPKAEVAARRMPRWPRWA